MTFQKTVNSDLPFGAVGDVVFDSPTRAKSYSLDSGDEENNVIGRVFTVKSEGVAEAGGTGVFAGILIHPKSYAYDGLFNNGTGDLSCRNGSQVELLTMGEVCVAVDAQAAIGGVLKYVNATGEIKVGAAGGGETAIPNAVVSTYTVAGEGIAFIQLTN